MSDNSNLILNALYRTDPDLYNDIAAGSSWIESVIIRGARVALYRKYELGDHRADITTQMRKMLRLRNDAAGLNDFNDNYCRIIVDKMAGRVQITEISVNEEATEWLNEALEKNDFDAIQGMWWRGGIRDGDSFVLIDPQTMQWTSEPAYDGFSGVVAIFDPVSRKPVWACKLWSESDQQIIDEEKSEVVRMQIVVYQPDKISWWEGGLFGTEIEPMEHAAPENSGADAVEIEAPEGNVMPWATGKIPLVHFANQQDNYTLSGDSELRPAIPLQDVLNRTLYSMVMASEFSAFPIKWAIGMGLDVAGIQPGAVLNMVLSSNDLTAEQIAFLNAVRVGQFDAADLSQYTGQIDLIVKQISQCTQTPIYGVTADGNLSGEALKQLEIGLIGKVKRFQRQNSDAVKSLVMMTAEIQNTYDTGLGAAPEIDKISITWKSPEILNADAEIATLAAMKEKLPGLFDDDFYRAKIGGLLGMSQTEIKAESEKAGLAQSAAFDKLVGNGGTIPPV